MTNLSESSQSSESPGPVDPVANVARAGRERLWVSILVLVLSSLPFLPALIGGKVALAVDGTSAHLPWGGVEAASERGVPQNPELSDQGVQFYPFYKWVARSWISGDPPYWCPDIYAGAPGVGNAQSGALDPQVWLLCVLQVIGGDALFDWGFGLLAWLRIAVAMGGAYALARRLGLQSPGAFLCACAFAFSGYQVLWLNHALGHVPPLLPWTLFFLEGIAKGRTSAGHSLLSAGAAALCFALAILGGHVETAFYVGCAAGIWALSILRRDRASGFMALGALLLGTGCGAASLWPVYEYLELSAAKYVRELSATEARAALDLIALGLLVFLVGLVVHFRNNVSAVSGGTRHDVRVRYMASGGLVLAILGGALVFGERFGIAARLALIPDLFGHPARGGYFGEGTLIENGSAWVAFPVLALAFAGIASAQSHLSRRGIIVGLGVVMFLLAIELPGLLDLYRFVPVVGLGATVRCASVSALMLGLLAGDALESAGRLARVVSVASLFALSASVLHDPGPAPLAEHVQRSPDADEHFGMVLYPDAPSAGRAVPFEGWVSSTVPFDRAVLILQRLDPGGSAIPDARFVLPLPIDTAPSAKAAARVAAASVESSPEVPAGAVWFQNTVRDTGVLEDGHWALSVALYRDDSDQPIGTRKAGLLTVQRGTEGQPLTLLFVLLGGLCALVPIGSWRDRSPALVWMVPSLVLFQGLWFAWGINPLVPRAQVFPPTLTEEILARELGPYRFFSDADVLPPNTGLIRGLRGIQGYDAMDVLDFNFYRETILPAGGNALLQWTPRGVDLSHPAFRLYGVGMLVCSTPFEHPDWELFAGPASPDESMRSEAFLYRARDPLPRAFCVPRVVELAEFVALFQADPENFDPRAVCAIEGSWRPATPFTEARVSTPRFTNTEVFLRAQLDGDGLLLLSEQNFPGWNVYVDGEQREVFTADMIFRGVALEAGEHEVVFRYEPASIHQGLWISGLSAACVGLLCLLGLFRARRNRVES